MKLLRSLIKRMVNTITINLNGVLYNATRLPKGIFSITTTNKEVFNIVVKVDSHLKCTWTTNEGHSNSLIDKIGCMIEVHDLKF
jgi:hypothetical protein